MVDCFIELSPEVTSDLVRVDLHIKEKETQDSYIGIRLRFPCDKDVVKIYGSNIENAYTMERHLVEPLSEQKELFDDVPKNILLRAPEAIEQKALYRVTFSYKNGRIERVAYPRAPYKTTVPENQAKFKALKGVGMCKPLSFFPGSTRIVKHISNAFCRSELSDIRFSGIHLWATFTIGPCSNHPRLQILKRGEEVSSSNHSHGCRYSKWSRRTQA